MAMWYAAHPEPVRLDEILARRAAAPAEGGWVYVKGGLVPRVASVPVDSGVEAIVRYADRCHHKVLELQMAELKRDPGHAKRHLARAEQALRDMSDWTMTREVALALAAVRAAKELL